MLLLDQGHVDAHVELGLLLRDHDAHEAASHLEQAAKLRPNDADIWKNLAGVQLHIGEAAAAEHSLQQALRLQPDDAQVRDLLQSVQQGTK